LIEQFGVAASSMPMLTFEQDVDVLIAAEVGGIGVDEAKLGAGPDAGRLAQFYESGLRATSAVPALRSILPVEASSGLVSDADLAERLSKMCSSVRRLAAFDPVAFSVQTGPVCGRTPEEFRALIVHSLRTLARTATKLHPRPFQIALEPVAPEWAAHGWPVTSLSDAAELIEETGEPNVKIVLDTWHQADVAAEQIARFADNIVLVQIAERGPGAPHPPGSAATDRQPMGEGDGHSSSVLRSLFEAGYRGWYEMETPVGSDPEQVTSVFSQARGIFRELYREMAGI
jgi:sugar phosphate isomerase/epimerase